MGRDRLISFVDLVVKITICSRVCRCAWVFAYAQHLYICYFPCVCVSLSLPQIPNENHVIQAVRQSGCHDHFHLHLCFGLFRCSCGIIHWRQAAANGNDDTRAYTHTLTHIVATSNEVIKGDLSDSFVSNRLCAAITMDFWLACLSIYIHQIVFLLIRIANISFTIATHPNVRAHPASSRWRQQSNGRMFTTFRFAEQCACRPDGPSHTAA